MMKKGLLMLILVSIGVLVAACSNNDSEESQSTADQADSGAAEFATESSRNVNGTESANNGQESAPTDQQESSSNEDNTASQADESTQSDRKIIYTANLRIEVKDYQKSVDDIQSEVSERGGYVVESNMHEGSEDRSTRGMITARVPQEEFRDFIQAVEDGSSDVLESSVSGQDVTEEYVDLESRLESKRVVEKRLQSFMEEAEKTEDLLEISEDLGKVQQEIEEITGRMNYLENKVDLATVTIQIEENNMSISSEEELNTWEKTKQQFMKSINFILSAFSGLFVFIIGNFPILILLGMVGLAIFWIIKKRKKDQQEN